MTGSHAAEYIRSVKIRDNAVSTGEDMRRNCLTRNRERANYAALGYAQRLETIEDAAGETKGILVEWGAVRIADSCFQTLLKIQTPTNAMQKLLDGKIERRHTCPGKGRESNLELLNETRYGRLLINTAIYIMPHRSMPIHGIHTPHPNRANANPMAREKKPIEAIAKAPGVEFELYHGKIEDILDNAAKHAGLKRTKYK